ncbi:MAG: 1-(5-phosphoribosyl)-5-[(5-phosphoribosylamino)methylideneamino]imidazole-4-carboxamide isomerase [Armatimonadota bacterium]
MEIIPAIDLRGGRCVRLLQGDYAKETVFSEDPGEMARHWEEEGAPRLHVVDLDGAREGKPANLAVIGEICEAVAIPVQLGGGIRDELTARRALDLGVQRVIIGTAALDPLKAEALAASLGDSVVAGIDAKGGMVAVRGWLEVTHTKATELARRLISAGFRWLVYTDIARDGMLQGANVPAMRAMIEAVPEAHVIASGGITTAEDVRKLKQAGAAGAIIGMALYSRRLTLKEALEAAR